MLNMPTRAKKGRKRETNAPLQPQRAGLGAARTYPDGSHIAYQTTAAANKFTCDMHINSLSNRIHAIISAMEASQRGICEYYSPNHIAESHANHAYQTNKQMTSTTRVRLVIDP